MRNAVGMMAVVCLGGVAHAAATAAAPLRVAVMDFTPASRSHGGKHGSVTIEKVEINEAASLDEEAIARKLAFKVATG